MINNSTHEFERLVGKAALALWPDLPRDVQENLFETAVAGEVIIRNIWLRTCTTTTRKRRIRQSRPNWLEAGEEAVDGPGDLDVCRSGRTVNDRRLVNPTRLTLSGHRRAKNATRPVPGFTP
jgi:hypothetical protein